MKSLSLRRLTSNGLRFGPSSQAIVSNERRGILPPSVIWLAIVLFPAPALPRRTSLIFSSNTLLKANENKITAGENASRKHGQCFRNLTRGSTPASCRLHRLVRRLRSFGGWRGLNETQSIAIGIAHIKLGAVWHVAQWDNECNARRGKT